MTTRLTLRTATTTAVVLVLSAAPAYAAAGGGSAGFRGGGGGGGRGRGGGLGWILFWMFAHPIVLAFVVGVALCFYLYGRAQTARGTARRHARATRVVTAAAEAAEDDAAFSPEVVREQSTSLFNEIQSAWDAGHR